MRLREVSWSLEMTKMLAAMAIAAPPNGSEVLFVILGLYNTESASGWMMGDLMWRRVRSWQGSSTAAPSPSLEKADHVCMKWKSSEASTAKWWKVVPNATPDPSTLHKSKYNSRL
jgi:hypothetical protein